MSRRYRRWEQHVLALTRRMDSTLLRLVMVSAVMLVMAQLALRSALFLSLFSRVDRLEGAGKPNFAQLAAWERFIAERAVSGQTAGLTVTLELLQPSPTAEIKLLVNGEIRGSFAERVLTVPVKPGDLIEIDAVEETDAVTVRVNNVSEGIQKPIVGQYLQARQEVRPLGRVDTKEIR